MVIGDAADPNGRRRSGRTGANRFKGGEDMPKWMD